MKGEEIPILLVYFIACLGECIQARSTAGNNRFQNTLGLAGMELTLFIAAQTVLCFRSVTKTMLITH